jgi:hypothetical protein
MLFFYMLVAYGVAFGFQNKLTFLYSEGYRETGEPANILDRLLHCTYCTGFHTGWMVWLLSWWIEGKLPAEGWAVPASVLVWSFASAAFCYVVDAFVRWLESGTMPTRIIEEPEEEDEDA